MASETKSKGGRPAFEPTGEQRKTVEAMAGYGIPRDEICLVVVNPQTDKPLSEKTLAKHFAPELRRGGVVANARVVESLFQQAVGRREVVVDGKTTVKERRPNVTAAIWWTKARMGWKETQGREFSGSDDKPPIQFGSAEVVRYEIPDNGRDTRPAGAAGKLSRESG